MNTYSKAMSGAALVLSCGFLPQDPPTRQPGTQQPGTQQPGTHQPGTHTQQPGVQTPDTRTAGHESNDSILVTWLLVDNENEIALARIATQRAQSPEVKQFAQRMIDDHSQIVQKLRQASTGVAANRVGQVGADRDRPGTGATGTDRPATGTGNTGTGTQPPVARNDDPNRDPNRDPTRDPGASRDPKGEYGTARDASARLGMAAGIDHERLIRDLGQKCLQSHTQMLQEKSGAEFDKCFMGMQLGAHVKAVDTIEVFRNYASPALRPTLDEGLKTVQMHLDHAKDLVKRTETSMADVGRK